LQAGVIGSEVKALHFIGSFAMKTHPRTVISTALLALAVLGSDATASVLAVGLYDTGVDNSDVVLANGTTDAHYLLGSSPTYAVDDAEGYAGAWMAPSAASSWITPLVGPGNTGSGAVAVGDYTYSTTFDLTGYDTGSAVVNGLVSADNSVTSVLINGNTISFSAHSDYSSFASFTVTAGFVAGVNTLSFVVNNSSGPTGLRAELDGSFTAAVPEPETYAMLLAGLGVLGFMSRSRKAD
jgi:hypothetical protein